MGTIDFVDGPLDRLIAAVVVVALLLIVATYASLF